MDLNTYLHTALPTPCVERPFVCDGRPESCTVIIIGENPVTTMNHDWWSFWNDDAGFDLTGFEQTYEASRSLIGKRPISNTRLRLRRMRSRGIRCLETNAFRNERLAGHGKGTANKDLLQAVIERLPQLRAIVAHGNVAARCLSGMVLPGTVARHYVGHFRSLSYVSLDILADALLDLSDASASSWGSGSENSLFPSTRVFNIKGNDYRLVVAINYHFQVLLIKWLGTHKEYDRIDVEEVTYDESRYANPSR